MARDDGARMQRLTIMLQSRDRVHHHSLATELLSRARHAGLAGATLLEAEQGQGRSGVVHRQHLFTEDAPLSLLVVDDEAKIAAFLEDNAELLAEAIVVVADVAAFRA